MPKVHSFFSALYCLPSLSQGICLIENLFELRLKLTPILLKRCKRLKLSWWSSSPHFISRLFMLVVVFVHFYPQLSNLYWNEGSTFLDQLFSLILNSPFSPLPTVLFSKQSSSFWTYFFWKFLLEQIFSRLLKFISFDSNSESDLLIFRANFVYHLVHFHLQLSKPAGAHLFPQHLYYQ